MNAFRTRLRSGFQPFNTTLLLFLFLCTGCNLSKNEAVGTYIRASGTITETLQLNQDGTFSQIIKTDHSQMWQTKGTWKLLPRGVELSEFYMTYDREKQQPIIPPKLTSLLAFWKDGYIVLDDDSPTPYVFRKITTKP